MATGVFKLPFYFLFQELVTDTYTVSLPVAWKYDWFTPSSVLCKYKKINAGLVKVMLGICWSHKMLIKSSSWPQRVLIVSLQVISSQLKRGSLQSIGVYVYTIPCQWLSHSLSLCSFSERQYICLVHDTKFTLCPSLFPVSSSTGCPLLHNPLIPCDSRFDVQVL